jgi:glycine hydroxymethyltransferase
MSEDFKAYQKRILDNARTMAEELKKRGYHIVSGGTDTHLFLVSFINEKFSGKKVEKALDKAGITVNKNTVPFDHRKPFVTSGIRVGTPAITTRGMGVEEMKIIADFIDRAIQNREDDEVLAGIAGEVKELCAKFPLYAERQG